MKKTIKMLGGALAIAIASQSGLALAETDIQQQQMEIQQRIQERMNNARQQPQQPNRYTATPESQQRFHERMTAIQDSANALAKEAKENDDTEANPVCEVVLCMFGKLKGASQSECSSAEKQYFKIVKKKKGKIKWSQTAKKRLDFLNGCPSPENDAINKKFGRVLG